MQNKRETHLRVVEKESVETYLHTLNVRPYRKKEASDGSINDSFFEDTHKRIFESWYANQSMRIDLAIRRIKIPNPKSSEDILFNLLCESYLFGKRATIRQDQPQGFLRQQYGTQERADFALEDVEFQQNILELLGGLDINLATLFWDDLKETHAELGRKPHEITGSIKGILAMRAAANILLEKNFCVYIPSVEMDAREGIDLIATRDDQIYFVQVKSFNNKEKISPGGYSLISQIPGYDASKIKDQRELDFWSKMQSFFTKIDFLSREKGFVAKPLLLIIPNPFINDSGIDSKNGDLKTGFADNFPIM